MLFKEEQGAKLRVMNRHLNILSRVAPSFRARARFYSVVLVIFTLLTSVSADKNALEGVAAKAFREGKDASLNAFFAGHLGISTKQAIPLKRLKVESNIFNVSVTDPRTIILSVQAKNLTTYYLTDTSGQLKRAIINDSAVANGGLTNIPLNRAEAGFKEQVSFWQRHSKK